MRQMLDTGFGMTRRKIVPLNLARWAAGLVLPVLTTTTSVPAARVLPDDATTDFKEVGIRGTGSGKDFKELGSGSAIAPNWVIGVAHVGGKVFIEEGKVYPIDQKVFHKVDKGESAELALYHLAKPVPIHADILTKQ